MNTRSLAEKLDATLCPTDAGLGFERFKAARSQLTDVDCPPLDWIWERNSERLK